MCTIRRARIRKLIKYHKNGKNNRGLFLIDIDCLPVMDETKLEDVIKLMQTKGVMLNAFNNNYSVKKIRVIPRKL
jgi:hypothetical protein